MKSPMPPPPVSRRGAATLVSLLALACGSGSSGTDDVGDVDSTDAGTDNDSGTTDSDSSSDSSDSSSDSSDSSSDSSDSSGDSSDSSSDSTDSSSDSTGGGEIPSCFPEPGETLWSLSCEGCVELPQNSDLVGLSVEGSQIPGDFLICGHFQFEGTVTDHPGPTQWVIDACPCNQDCLLPDPHTIDLAAGLPHPAPELLPTELGQCVRVDVWKAGSLGGLETFCTPEAIALWNLDGDQPVLRHAQGGSNDFTFPIDLGELEVDATLDCFIANDSSEFRTWIDSFTIGVDTVAVPEQHSDILLTPLGDYEAINVIAQHEASNLERTSPAFWWLLHPTP